jgi:hypothetical protein
LRGRNQGRATTKRPSNKTPPVYTKLSPVFEQEVLIQSQLFGTVADFDVGLSSFAIEVTDLVADNRIADNELPNPFLDISIPQTAKNTDIPISVPTNEPAVPISVLTNERVAQDGNPGRWPLRSHLLAPLSSLTSSKVKWKWTAEHQESFDKMTALIAKETLLTTFQKNLKYILMPANYNLELVSPKTVSRWLSIQENYNQPKQDIILRKENCYHLYRDIKGIQKHTAGSEDKSPY